MEASMADYKNVKNVVQLSSASRQQCPICQSIPKLSSNDPDVGEQINHYLGHGYKLLHVGQETIDDSNGNPLQTTVAVLGK
jgi:hypothetical protein